MRVLNLFLCISGFVVLSISCVLIAQESNYNDMLSKQDSSNDETVLLVSDICDLLQQGYSPDEVIRMLGDKYEHTDGIQNFVKYVQDVLVKQKSKDVVINIISKDREADKYFARKNFWSNIKNFIFILKTIVVLVICYLIYEFIEPLRRFIKKLIEMVWRYFRPPGGSFDLMEIKVMEESTDKSQKDDQFIGSNQSSSDSEIKTSETQTIENTKPVPERNAALADEKYRLVNDPLVVNIHIPRLDNGLAYDIAKQVEFIKSLNIDPNAQHFDYYMSQFELWNLMGKNFTDGPVLDVEVVHDEIFIRELDPGKPWTAKMSTDVQIEWAQEKGMKINLPPTDT